MIFITSDSEREQRIKTYESTLDCRHCGKCQRAFADHDPVWRMRINHRRAMFGWSYDTVPCCEACATANDFRVFENPAPCEHCGRIVHNELRMIDRRHVHCCTNCESRAQSRVARQKRTEARGVLECTECGDTFQPTRNDAKFCGNSCRQKAYRKRVTDNKLEQPDRFNSRNTRPVVTDNELLSVTPNQ